MFQIFHEILRKLEEIERHMSQTNQGLAALQQAMQA